MVEELELLKSLVDITVVAWCLEHQILNLLFSIDLPCAFSSQYTCSEYPCMSVGEDSL